MSAAPDLSGFSKEEIVETLAEIRHPFEIAVYGSGNEFNFAGIIRTAHNFLASRIYAIDMGWYYPKGAVTTLKWEKHVTEDHTIESFLERTKDRNIVAFERRNDLNTQDIRTFNYPESPILLFGGEKYGIPDSLLNRSDHIVSIPAFGFVNSLNIAMASGIAMFDWINKHYARKNSYGYASPAK